MSSLFCINFTELFYAYPRIKIPAPAKLKPGDKMEFLLVFTAGSLIYGLMELVWRGWTHWSMLLCGGLCLSLMYLVSSLDIHFLLKLMLSAAIITWVEFTAGCLINLRLGWQVWDYSCMPGNIMGQICPQFCLLWLGLSAPGLYLCSLIRNLLFKASAE